MRYFSDHNFFLVFEYFPLFLDEWEKIFKAKLMHPKIAKKKSPIEELSEKEYASSR